MTRSALGAVLALLLALARPAAGADPASVTVTLTVEPPSANERAPLVVRGDTNLSNGAVLWLELLHLGQPLASGHAKVEERKFTALLDPGRPLPATWYDVLAVWRPEAPPGPAPGSPAPTPRVIAGVAFAVGAPEEARGVREEELAYAAEALAQGRVLFETLRDGLAQRAARPAEFRPAGWATDYAGWADRTAELKTQLATRRERRGFALLPAVEERTLGLFEMLHATHRQLTARSPFVAAVDGPLPAPAPAPEEAVAALVAHLEPRLLAAEHALERERRLGDRAALVAQLRGLWSLRDRLLHTRQPRTPAGKGFGEDVLRARQEEIEQAQWRVNALQGQELAASHPTAYRALAALPATLAGLWDALQRFTRGVPEATRQVQEADESFRSGFARVIDELELRPLFPEIG